MRYRLTCFLLEFDELFDLTVGVNRDSLKNGLPEAS